MATPADMHPQSAGRTAFSVRPAGAADLAEVRRVQRSGFGRVAAGLGIPPEALEPMRDTLEDLVALHGRGVTFLIAEADGRVVGTVRAAAGESGTVTIGRLAIDDGWERLGLATALMTAVERAFPDARRFELYTGADAEAPLALYAKLGYRQFRREDLGYVVLVWLAKDR